MLTSTQEYFDWLNQLKLGDRVSYRNKGKLTLRTIVKITMDSFELTAGERFSRTSGSRLIREGPRNASTTIHQHLLKADYNEGL